MKSPVRAHPTPEGSRTEFPCDPRGVLVLGMGAYAFGRERRATRALDRMRHVRPYVHAPKWGDGSVPRLLRERGFRHELVPYGYLGRARPHWTAISLAQLPSLQYRTVRGYRGEGCRSVLVLNLLAVVNYLPALCYLRYRRHADVVFYLGDITAPSRVSRWIAAMANRLGRIFIVNSRAVGQSLLRLGIPRDKVRVVYNGVDTRRFGSARPLGLRERFGWGPDTFLVGYIGQLSERKGVEDFLDAAECVLRETDGVAFVVIGDAPGNTRLRDALHERVRANGSDAAIAFAGRIEAIERAYADLDLVVVPSRHQEPAANVVVEAAAAGVPVIATRSGGIPELLDDGETGVLVDRAAPDQIARWLVKLKRDDRLRERLGTRARRRAARRFDSSYNAARVERILLGHLPGATGLA